MKLQTLLGDYPVLQWAGRLDTEVQALYTDSRQVQPGGLFFAVKGTEQDGHAYIAAAIEKGAVAIVCEILPEDRPEGVAFVQVQHAAKAVGHLASAFYGHPSRRLSVVAVTGTNGKTTTATLLYRLFRRLGYRSGLLSTVENRIEDEVIPAKLTTPDPISIQQLMARMVAAGCTHCFMEASSHAIVQERMAGIRLAGAMFTNITHDHLDYHKTFDQYIKAKKKLFDDLPAKAFALTNRDDKRGMVMLQNCAGRHYTFALHQAADFKGRLIANTFDGLQMEVNGREAWFRLLGEFNAYNLLGIYGAAVLLGEDEERVLTELSGIEPAQGRFQQHIGRKQVRAIVDYAHTPDALQNVLDTLLALRKDGERILTVVGCGGNRDATKRPVMARIAVDHSDRVFLTSDNPRHEDPATILADMEAGIPLNSRHKASTIEDRRQAILAAVRYAEPYDIILIAGKGHENYQEIKGVRHPFDDLLTVSELLSQEGK